MAARLPPGSDAARAALTRLPEPGHDLAAEFVQAKGDRAGGAGHPGAIPPHQGAFCLSRHGQPLWAICRALAPRAGAQSVLETNAAGSAAVNLTPDPDGVVRRIPLVFQLGPALVPGLAAEVLRVSAGPDITVASNERDPLTFFSGPGIAALETSSRNRAHRYQRARAPPRCRQCLGAHAQSQCADAVPIKGAIVVIGAEGQVVKTPWARQCRRGDQRKDRESGRPQHAGAPTWARTLEASLLLLLGAA